MSTALSSPASSTPKAPRAAAPGSAMREQERRTRTVWINRKRFAVAGPPPTAEESARMVAEFLARGGQITVCGTAHALPFSDASFAGTSRVIARRR